MSDKDLHSSSVNRKLTMMTTAPVGPLIGRLAVPTIIVMMVSAMYNMADTYFVSSLGTSATAGVGIAFPLMTVIQAVGFFFGHGSGNFISRSLGAGKTPDAEKMAATGFFTAFFIGGFIAVLGTAFQKPLAQLLGSTSTILPHAVSYLRFILLGAPFMVSSLMLNNLLRHQGSTFFGMIGMTSGAVINIALDPLFILVLGMGVKGASLATMISQCVSFTLLLFVGCRKGGNVRISFRNFSPSINRYREMIRGGTPSLLRQSMQSFAALFLNHAAGAYGDAVIAAIAIVNRIILISESAIFGFGQSFQPVCGFNYGAKRYDRVKKAFWFCVRLSVVLLSLAAIAGLIYAPAIIALFRKDDPTVISVGSFMLRAQCLILPIFGWTLFVNMMTQTMGKAIPASILAFSRQGFFLIPQLFLLVPLLGVLGIQICIPIADVCTFILSLFIGIRVLRRDLAEPPQGTSSTVV
jgi:putative MATE family efflux protein